MMVSFTKLCGLMMLVAVSLQHNSVRKSLYFASVV
jgi:hypothetical protein